MKWLVKSWLVGVVIILLAGSSFGGTYSGGSGEPSDPYQIGTADDIIEMSNEPNDWNDGFVMIADVNMIDYTFTTAVIGTFTGVFDGADHKIINLSINTAGAGNDSLGLFGYISGEEAQVKNLGLAKVTVIGGDTSSCLGGLCGSNDSTISNCYSEGSVRGDYNVGGLCGSNDGTISNCYSEGSVRGGYYSRADGLGGLCGENFGGIISNCYATGEVTGGDNSLYLGGLCGYNDGMISNCYSEGWVTGGDDSWRLGGLCGINSDTINNCYATGSVEGSTDLEGSGNLGGLCGYNSYSTIINCYATGSITGDDYLGGLCGRNYKGTISNCYATGYVTGGEGSSNLGGLCGYQKGEDSELINSFWDTETSGMSIGYNLDSSEPGTVINVLGKTTSEMQIQTTFTDYGLDFISEDVNGTNDIWRMCEDGIDYPHLSWEYSINGDFACPDGVDIDELLSLSENWLNSEELDPGFSYPCDPTFDGITNLSDLAILSSHWLEEN